MTTGLCECGCGGKTSLTTYTNSKTGVAKGTPLRFVRHHQWKNQPIKSYRNGPMVEGKNKRAHRLRAEKALGKPLPLGAVVHHADGSIGDDSPLVICQDQAYHLLLHVRMRAVRAGGNPNTERFCRSGNHVVLLSSYDEVRGRCKPCEKVRKAKYQ